MIAFLKDHLLKRYNYDERDFINVVISREIEPLMPFQMECLNRRKNDKEAIYAGLEHSGSEAIKVLEKAFER